MNKIIRVSLKFVGAVALILALLTAAFVVAWLILQTTDPTETILYFLAMSAFSGILIAGLTVYRLIRTLRSASLTLLLTMPMMISLMSGLIIWWTFLKPLLVTEAAWTKGIVDLIQQFLNYLHNHFGY